MTAPVRRRPLPALALIGVLLLLTAFVWFRVIHRGDADSSAAAQCPSPSTSTSSAPAARPTVLPYPNQVAVLLLNSTHRDSLAKRTRPTLKARGFKITATANDDPKYGGSGLITSVGEIRYGRRAVASATLLSYYFPGASLHRTGSANAIVIVSLGRKFRTIATGKAVATALRKAGARQSRSALRPTPTPSPSPSGC